MKLLFSILTMLALAVPAWAQQTIFVVRHAERTDGGAGTSMMAADPDLSDKGQERAQALARILKDARITSIYTTQYKRTVQTAAPLAQALGIQTTTVDARDTAALVEKVKAGGNALVVGHSNTLGPILQQLGISEPVTIADEDYDNLFVVVRADRPTLVRLHFR